MRHTIFHLKPNFIRDLHFENSLTLITYNFVYFLAARNNMSIIIVSHPHIYSNCNILIYNHNFSGFISVIPTFISNL